MLIPAFHAEDIDCVDLSGSRIDHGHGTLIAARDTLIGLLGPDIHILHLRRTAEKLQPSAIFVQLSPFVDQYRVVTDGMSGPARQLLVKPAHVLRIPQIRQQTLILGEKLYVEPIIMTVPSRRAVVQTQPGGL